MLLQSLIFLSLSAIAVSLQCYSCGVFLSAPSMQCRGTPRNHTCDPDNLGCLSLLGQNPDGTYYVEKRCAETDDDLTEGCIEIGLRGMRIHQCLCKDDLCNTATTLFALILPLLISSFIYFISTL